MNLSRSKQLFGGILLIFALGLFGLQVGYVVFDRQFEYYDHRLFYGVNMLCCLSLGMALYLLLKLSQKALIIIGAGLVLFIVVNTGMLIQAHERIETIKSVSPQQDHSLILKYDADKEEAVYYRPYYGLFARPIERLTNMNHPPNVMWLARDVAVITYETTEGNQTYIEQFVATYGDRGNGVSYYDVAPSLQGSWFGHGAELVSSQDGVEITADGRTEHFSWDDMTQYGTLAVVLRSNGEARWTVALAENMEVSSSGYAVGGNLRLYEASGAVTEVITLSENQQ